MNRAQIILAAAHFLDRIGERPSRRTIQRFLAKNLGKGYGSDEIAAVLRGTRWGRNCSPGPVEDNREATSGPSSVREMAVSGPPEGPPRSTHARDSTVLPLVGDLEATGSTAVSSPSGTQLPTNPSPRCARASKPYPEIPDDLRDDVDRLIANDARQRRDGKIAVAIIETNLLTLRRAFEQRGLDALRRGIDVALDKGKGVRFAAGCVRNYDPARDADRSGPALFAAGNGVATDRGNRTSAIPEYADVAVYRELSRPGEAFADCSRRLHYENFDGWCRLNGYPVVHDDQPAGEVARC